jgi:hypothetical protein
MERGAGARESRTELVLQRGRAFRPFTCAAKSPNVGMYDIARPHGCPARMEHEIE